MRVPNWSGSGAAQSPPTLQELAVAVLGENLVHHAIEAVGGAWGARFQGDTSQLPANLKGLTISVTASSGKSWIATVTEIVGRSSDLVVVGTQKLDQ